jgi:hypothetical protein
MPSAEEMVVTLEDLDQQLEGTLEMLRGGRNVTQAAFDDARRFVDDTERQVEALRSALGSGSESH